MLKFGNMKLPASTLIFNMGTATNCPSKLIGLCEVVNCGIRCYAEKAEVMYKKAKAYRERQEVYWNSTEAKHIYHEFLCRINERRTDTLLFRFNESGDFRTQEDVNKLNEIAKSLLDNKGIVTYGYTARRDLDFSGVDFIIRGSFGGITDVIPDGMKGLTKVVDKDYVREPGWIICPGSCKTCSLCSSDVTVNVAFKKH